MGKIRSLFPDTDLIITHGPLQEGGTSVIEGQERKGPQRWVKLNDILFVGMNDGLYHTRYNELVSVVHDKNNKVVGYWNHTSKEGTQPNKSGVIGAVALSFLVSAALFLMGAWNFVWKYEPFLVKDNDGNVIHERWWLTISVVLIYSLWSVFWTYGFACYEWQRQKIAHQLLLANRA
jgi:hypothetical protein